MWKKMSQVSKYVPRFLERTNFVIVNYLSKNVVKYRDAQEKSLFDS